MIEFTKSVAGCKLRGITRLEIAIRQKLANSEITRVRTHVKSRILIYKDGSYSPQILHRSCATQNNYGVQKSK